MTEQSEPMYRVTFVDPPPEPEPTPEPDIPDTDVVDVSEITAGPVPASQEPAEAVAVDAVPVESAADLAVDEVAPVEAAPVGADEDTGLAPVSAKPAPVQLPIESLRPALEAILLVVDEPVAEVLLAQVLERPREEVAGVLEALAAEYTEAGRGFDLRRAAGGWRLYTREEFAPYVEKFVLDGQQARLTQAALETLAVVAYKQPVTRSRISAIRGVAVDGVIRTLLTRGMIEECGAEPDSGAHLYRTTTLFLEKLGLDSIDELPSLAPLLPDLDTLDDVIAAT